MRQNDKIMDEEILKRIQNKYKAQDENPEMYLHGLLHQKPVNYWEYVEVDTLLTLQKTRTNFHDETVFIVYHQITELVLKLMIHELKVLTKQRGLTIEEMAEKVYRLNRYTSMLINSFGVLTKGMDYEAYNQFRLSLAPASGFQSAQFRLIELYCTKMENLIHDSRKEEVPKDATTDDLFDYVYWQEAGLDHKTGKKSLTLREFEEKYLDEFKALARDMKDKNLQVRVEQMKDEGKDVEPLRNALRTFDRAYNIEWPIVHLQTANSYLARKGEAKQATGSSDWQKYLHPAFQRRKFFPNVWSKDELDNWAKDFL